MIRAMDISRYTPIIKLLAVVMVSEIIIMSSLHLLSEDSTPWLIDMLDVLLLGLITAVVAQLWIVRPLDQAREQDELFRSIAEHSHAGLVITDPARDNAIVYTNAAFSHITGYSMTEIKGKHPNLLSQGLGFQAAQEKISTALKTAQPVSALLKNRRKDGSIFWNDLHLSPINIREGVPHYWLGLLHDVTETKALSLQVEHLVSAIEQAGDMICIFDQHGCIDFINQSFRKQIDFSEQQIKGQSVWRYWHDTKWSKERVQHALKENGQWSGRNWWMGAKNAPYEAMTNISIVEGDDGQRMFIAVIRDMTEEIEMENKLAHAQKMEAVGTLAGGIAHDFNNMLAAMMGNLYLLKKNMHGDSSVVSRIESIEEQGYRGADLIRQMLIFARRQRVERQGFDLQLLAKETIKLLHARTPDDIRLDTNIDASSMILYGDPSLLQSTLFNLINNALFAIQEAQGSSGFDGIVDLSIHALPLDRVPPEAQQTLTSNGDESLTRSVHISVSDNGSGMDKATQKRVFEPYFTTKKLGKGTGLGLSMVMGCVEIHGGWIGLESSPDEGSKFDIYLPLNGTKTGPDARHETAIYPGNGELILIADDNAILCESVADILEDAGYQIIKAFDGEYALQQYMEHKADIRMAILDCVMPKLGGVEVAQAIWQHSGDSVKTVLMTGYDMGDSLTHEWAYGEQPLILQKPWNMEQLNGALRSMSDMVN